MPGRSENDVGDRSISNFQRSGKDEDFLKMFHPRKPETRVAGEVF
jgi:hypothetical protein